MPHVSRHRTKTVLLATAKAVLNLLFAVSKSIFTLNKLIVILYITASDLWDGLRYDYNGYFKIRSDLERESMRVQTR